jgi:hypothetical protein
METTTVRRDLDLTLVGPDVPVLVTAVLEYQPRDPYAVTAVILTPDGPIRWVFARDLLDEGLVHEVGDGDVGLAPMRDDEGHSTVQLRLSSPDGVAVLEASTDGVLDFLARSYVLVPPGREPQFLDIDELLAALIAD